MEKNNPKISIVIPVYKPDMEVFEKVRKMIAQQTIKAEIVESWNMPEIKSINSAIKRAKGDIIVTMEQDCIPENEFWLEKLVSVMKDEKVIAGVSDVYLPESYWKKSSFILRMLTLNDRELRKPAMCMKGCIYRKKDLQKAGLFNENLKSIDADTFDKLSRMGKIARANATVHHLYKYKNLRSFFDKYYFYSKENGKVAKKYGVNFHGFVQRVLRATPFLGFSSIIYRYPLRKHFLLLPIFLIFATGIHVVNVFGFWRGFLERKTK